MSVRFKGLKPTAALLSRGISHTEGSWRTGQSWQGKKRLRSVVWARTKPPPPEWVSPLSQTGSLKISQVLLEGSKEFACLFKGLFLYFYAELTSIVFAVVFSSSLYEHLHVSAWFRCIFSWLNFLHCLVVALKFKWMCQYSLFDAGKFWHFQKQNLTIFHLKMWRVGGKVVAGTSSPRPWPSASQQRLRRSSLPWVTVAALRPPLTLPPPPAQPPVASWRLHLQSPTLKSPRCDPPSPSAEQPSRLPCSTSFTTPLLLSITTCYPHS